jgi:hypothetical protein
MAGTSALFKGQGSIKFSERWPEMKPVVLKLLNQEHVTRDEWQNLFWLVLKWSKECVM